MKQGFSLSVALSIACAAFAQEANNPAAPAPATPISEPPAISAPSTPPPADQSSVAPKVEKPAPKPAAKKKKVKPAAKAAVKKSAPKTETAEAPLVFSPIGTAVVKGDNVNVRGQASFKGEVITKLKKGEIVTLLEEISLKNPEKDEPTNWFRISLPSDTPVWVFGDYIDAASQTVKIPRLNVRGGPGENFSVIARLQKGDSIKQIRKLNDWIEIEPPASAFGFVAADLLEKQAPAIPTPEPKPAEPAPAPAPEVVSVPPVETPQPAVETPAEPAVPAQPAPVMSEPAPAPAPEVLPKRVVKREGIVRKSRNIQSPTYFELEGWDKEKVIAYLHSPEEQQLDPNTKKVKSVPKFNLNEYVGRRVVVSGEEIMDKRWKSTPVIEIESIDLQQQ